MRIRSIVDCGFLTLAWEKSPPARNAAQSAVVALRFPRLSLDFRVEKLHTILNYGLEATIDPREPEQEPY
ncbi:MAG: hypothetical protein F6J93_32405 [Oscillatoria sp. SIO1A7]|nr:hypothetical protein [Oscillatoria sp. SIO1A7]